MSETLTLSRVRNNLRAHQRLGDRRRLHLQSLFYSLVKQRRRGPRRAVDRQKGHYVDFYDTKSLIIGVAILVMSCMDAHFTLLLLQHGAEEFNPLMKYLIDIDTALFIKTKIAVTAFCIIIIIAHKNFWLVKNKIRVHTVMSATMAMYIILINCQIAMLFLYD